MSIQELFCVDGVFAPHKCALIVTRSNSNNEVIYLMYTVKYLPETKTYAVTNLDYLGTGWKVKDGTHNYCVTNTYFNKPLEQQFPYFDIDFVDVQKVFIMNTTRELQEYFKDKQTVDYAEVLALPELSEHKTKIQQALPNNHYFKDYSTYKACQVYGTEVLRSFNYAVGLSTGD